MTTLKVKSIIWTDGIEQYLSTGIAPCGQKYVLFKGWGTSLWACVSTTLPEPGYATLEDIKSAVQTYYSNKILNKFEPLIEVSDAVFQRD